MNTQEFISRAVASLGGPVKAAKLLGVDRYQTVQSWVRNGNVPAKYAPHVERLTEGAFRCEDICTDVDWSVVRQSS